MRKVTLAVAALTFMVAGYVLAQVTPEKGLGEEARPRTFRVFPVAPEQAAPQVQAPKVPKLQQQPMRISEELGLRIEGTHDGRVVGTLVANVDGKWVDVHLASTNIRAVAPAVRR
jgi:hypothetical protein